jgi:uncharacterized SAM-binding protein YcdF (DUF218 family)
MFYFASRIAELILPVANLLFLISLAGVIALFTRYARLGRKVLAGVIVAYVLFGFGPLGAILIRPLEDRFPRPSEEMPAPTGIIVLGGALKAELTNARGVFALSDEGGRMTQLAILALRYPKARVVFSGGTPGLMAGEADEAQDAKKYLASLGVASSRVLLESRSRNTDENARFTHELVSPEPNERWLLVTSAAHIPRAVGSFRHAGFEVIAYPTDYRTEGKVSDFWEFRTEPLEGINMLDAATHEWLGLMAYWLAGKSDALLPGPDSH